MTHVMITSQNDTRAKVMEELRAAKRASSTPMDELEESVTNAEVSSGSLMIAAEAVSTATSS